MSHVWMFFTMLLIAKPLVQASLCSFICCSYKPCIHSWPRHYPQRHSATFPWPFGSATSWRGGGGGSCQKRKGHCCVGWRQQAFPSHLNLLALFTRFSLLPIASVPRTPCAALWLWTMAVWPTTTVSFPQQWGWNSAERGRLGTNAPLHVSPTPPPPQPLTQLPVLFMPSCWSEASPGCRVEGLHNMPALPAYASPRGSNSAMKSEICS